MAGSHPEHDRINPEAWRVAERLSAVASARGALAAVLTGSVARGEAHAESDLDLHFIGEGPAYELKRVGTLLVSSSWGSADMHRASFQDPARAGAAVPGWRGARVIRDPEGIAVRLRGAAQAWTWDSIGAEVLDAWVVEQLTGLSEEVHKLAIAIDRQHLTSAAIQRSILATRLAPIMTVHLRLLYDSENGLWDRVNDRMGQVWSSCQASALALHGEPFRVTCGAALRLWVLATDAASTCASRRQHAVLDHARALAAATLQQLEGQR